MELFERTGFLDTLQGKFEDVLIDEGHCILVSGEAGIGETSLIKEFCKSKKKQSRIYFGTCDALFTPRPLAPLYDILSQMHVEVPVNIGNMRDRAALFSGFLRELETQKERTIIIIEDIHWADEATLDFIKFFARRITRFQCLFILTYRDNEIQSQYRL